MPAPTSPQPNTPEATEQLPTASPDQRHPELDSGSLNTFPKLWLPTQPNTPEAKTAWTEVYGTLSTTMLDAAQKSA